MEVSIILVISIDERSTAAPEVQEFLTDYGCLIKTRLGLHELNPDFCSNEGLILLALNGEKSQIDELQTKLEAIHETVNTKTLDLNFAS